MTVKTIRHTVRGKTMDDLDKCAKQTADQAFGADSYTLELDEATPSLTLIATGRVIEWEADVTATRREGQVTR